MIIEIIAIVVAVTAVIWVITAVFLSAPDHSNFDEPRHDLHIDRSSVGAENSEVLRLVNEMQNQLRGVSKARRLFKLRCIFDEGFTEGRIIKEGSKSKMIIPIRHLVIISKHNIVIRARMFGPSLKDREYTLGIISACASKGKL